ncbi:MAG: hypothetical protein IPN71_06895 [Fibrobacteres bacterium]|nr:hypothetical protein [Fibrobacterota bacterium]
MRPAVLPPPIVTPPIAWIPKPREHVFVLLPDSAGIGSPYLGNFAAALTKLQPGDTLFVYGGGGDYLISGAISILRKGALSKPIVILSFGGKARFRMDQARDSIYQQYCLQIENSHVRIVGFTFIGGRQSAIKVGAGLLADGSIDLDSVDLDNPGRGIEITNLRGPVRVHNLVIRNAVQNEIPVRFVGNISLDTSNVFW